MTVEQSHFEQFTPTQENTFERSERSGLNIPLLNYFRRLLLRFEPSLSLGSFEHNKFHMCVQTLYDMKKALELHTQALSHTYTLTYTHIHTYLHTHTHTHTLTHTHTHTHTH
jgi:hypothetical protein